MAKDKKGFILYADIIGVIKKITEKDRVNNTNNSGELFLHILEYVNDNNPTPINDTIDLVFEPIKMQLKRDLTKYEHIKCIRSELGKKGAEVKKQNKAIANLAEANKADKDTVTDKDTVKESVSKEKNAHEFFPNQKVSTAQYFLDLPNSSYFNDFAKDMKVSVEVLKLRIPDFKINCEPEYTSFSKFFFHFKKWYLKTKQSIDKITPLYKSLD